MVAPPISPKPCRALFEPGTPSRSECPDSPRMMFKLFDVADENHVTLRRRTLFSGEDLADVPLDPAVTTAVFEIIAKKGFYFFNLLKTGKGFVRLNDKRMNLIGKLTQMKHGDTLRVGGKKNKNGKTYVMQHVFPNAEAIENNMTCGICHSIFSDPFSVVPCGHNFCRDCIGQWLESGNNLLCPTCKARITVPFALPNHSLRNIIEEYSPATGAMQKNCKVRKKESLEAYITPRVLREGTLRVFHETKCGKYPLCSF